MTWGKGKHGREGRDGAIRQKDMSADRQTLGLDPGRVSGISQEKVQKAGSWQLTQIHLFHHKLTTGAIEGAKAVALGAIPFTPMLAPDILELTVGLREPQGQVAEASYPGATIVTAQEKKKRKFRIGLALGDREIYQRREKRKQGSRRPNLGQWSK